MKEPDREELLRRIEDLKLRNHILRDREAALVAALEHYADHNNYHCEGCKDGSCKGNSYNQIYLPADGETHGYTIAEQALKEYRGER